MTPPSITVYPASQDNTGAAMVICPGGGHHDLFWELEGEQVAAWLNSQGMTGVILKYRCPRRPGDVKGVPPLGPLLDAQRAISTVRSRAAEWGINPDRICHWPLPSTSRTAATTRSMRSAAAWTSPSSSTLAGSCCDSPRPTAAGPGRGTAVAC